MPFDRRSGHGRCLALYTMPRPRPNSRVKDLPDLALLGSVGELDAEILRAALVQTFAFRETHPLPETLIEPPSFWEQPYAAMAETDDLPWRTLDEVHGAAAVLLDPVLGGGLVRGTWAPDRWRWRAR